MATGNICLSYYATKLINQPMNPIYINPDKPSLSTPTSIPSSPPYHQPAITSTLLIWDKNATPPAHIGFLSITD